MDKDTRSPHQVNRDMAEALNQYAFAPNRGPDQRDNKDYAAYARAILAIEAAMGPRPSVTLHPDGSIDIDQALTREEWFPYLHWLGQLYDTVALEARKKNIDPLPLRQAVHNRYGGEDPHLGEWLHLDRLEAALQEVESAQASK